MRLTISAFSTALYSTWIFIEELDLLFDAGDGVSAMLGQQTGKIRYIFLTHAHRDHLAGLQQLLQVNARDGEWPKVFYPKDCGSIPEYAEFIRRFDPHKTSVPWIGIEAGDRISIGKNRFVIAVRNEHVDAPAGVSKCFSFLLVEERRRLKPELRGVSEEEIARLGEHGGQDRVTEAFDHKLLGYSGDSPGGNVDCWRGAEVLIHESTFLYRHHSNHRTHERDRHSVLDEVLEMAEVARPDRLVLTHFSTRYQPGEVADCVRDRVAALGLTTPVFLVEPGEFSRDLFAQSPVNHPC